MFLILAGDDTNEENSDIMENLENPKEKKKVWRERSRAGYPSQTKLSAGK